MGTSYKIQLLNPLNSLQNGSYKEPCSGLDPSPFCSGYFDEDYIYIYLMDISINRGNPQHRLFIMERPGMDVLGVPP